MEAGTAAPERTMEYSAVLSCRDGLCVGAEDKHVQAEVRIAGAAQSKRLRASGSIVHKADLPRLVPAALGAKLNPATRGDAALG